MACYHRVAILIEEETGHSCLWHGDVDIGFGSLCHVPDADTRTRKQAIQAPEVVFRETEACGAGQRVFVHGSLLEKWGSELGESSHLPTRVFS